mmetsp:Transcript_13429/g.35474  ORF Transcript_13429/g.35474 Transcript_13429/m.35474 type:complete len:755 (+) Transcript_13429:86-2350(+)
MVLADEGLQEPLAENEHVIQTPVAIPATTDSRTLNLASTGRNRTDEAEAETPGRLDSRSVEVGDAEPLRAESLESYGDASSLTNSARSPLVPREATQDLAAAVASRSDAGLLEKDYLLEDPETILEEPVVPSMTPLRRIALYAFVTLVAVTGVTVGVLMSEGRLAETEEWIYSPVKRWQMVAEDHRAVVSGGMSEDLREGKRLGVIDTLCEVVQGRLYGNWILLTDQQFVADQPGYVMLTEGDVEVFREMPEEGIAVGICMSNSTTTTTTTTVTRTTTSSTTTTLPDRHAVKGGWMIAAPRASCREACREMGAHCKERSMEAHTPVMTGAALDAAWRQVVGQCGQSCLTVNREWGLAADVPSIHTKERICYVSADNRKASDFSCDARPVQDQQRICFCEDWFDAEGGNEHLDHGVNKEALWEQWQVVRYGMNPVKGLKTEASQTVGLKDGCVFVEGLREGRWLRLRNDEGFMPIYDVGSIFDGDQTLLERSNMSVPVPICDHTTTTTHTTTITSTTQTQTTTGWPYILCLSVVQPQGYELALVGEQMTKGAGIFACNDWEVYSHLRLPVGPPERNVFTSVFAAAAVGLSSDGWAANVELFMNFWAQVQRDGKFYRADWTLKVDPDAVLVPSRLRRHLAQHNHRSVYVATCDGHMYGAVEALSRRALETYFERLDFCREFMWRNWGEDLYMEMCLDRIGVEKAGDFGMVSDARCHGVSCSDPHAAAFHPFKSKEQWESCWSEALLSEGMAGVAGS